MKPLQKISNVLAFFVITLMSITGSTQGAASPTVTSPPALTMRTITDMAGITVTIPVKIERVAVLQPWHNSMLAMLGDGSKIVATTPNVQHIPWFKKFAPNISTIPGVFVSSTVNMEELLKAKPDIVILPVSSNQTAQNIMKTGIPVVQLSSGGGDDIFVELKKCVLFMGKIMGDSENAKANQYVVYLDSKLQMLKSRASAIPNEQKLKVVHLSSASPLKVDGHKSIIDAWINIAGGVNAATIDGPMKEISIEQLLKWNPDVIIIAGTMQTINDVKKDRLWQKLKAVQNGRVYLNPKGVFLWDRGGPEEALQIQWAAKTLYPNRNVDIDIQKEAKSFYKTYFNYDMSDDEMKGIMNPQE